LKKLNQTRKNRAKPEKNQAKTDPNRAKLVFVKKTGRFEPVSFFLISI
jgi:hypothetical protein